MYYTTLLLNSDIDDIIDKKLTRSKRDSIYFRIIQKFRQNPNLFTGYTDEQRHILLNMEDGELMNLMEKKFKSMQYKNEIARRFQDYPEFEEFNQKMFDIYGKKYIDHVIELIIDTIDTKNGTNMFIPKFIYAVRDKTLERFYQTEAATDYKGKDFEKSFEYDLAKEQLKSELKQEFKNAKSYINYFYN